MLCAFGCTKTDHSTPTESSTTLQDLVYVDMFSPSYNTQHPLVCSTSGDFPNGKEMAFKHSESKESIHAVFPEGVTPPDSLKGKFILYGDYQSIQNRDKYKLKSPKEDYQYFVVSSWEYMM